MNTKRKKIVKTILVVLSAFVLLSAAAFVFLSNSDKGGGNDQVSSIFFREDTVTVEKFETYTLELQGVEDKTIEWKSMDESVATVQDGVVCGWKKGNTQIIACVDGKEFACNVIVLDNQYIPVIVLRDSDEVMMDIGSTLSLQPVLHYNGKTYSDVEYKFTGKGDAVTVDEAGVITAVEAGEALVCVQGTWRSNVVDATLTVRVVDVSTSIEVSGNVFDIYLNGRSKEFPSSVDIGISIFDQDTPIKEENASVKYVELIMAGDVSGAVTIKNGIAYAAKIGTTHFVAEYTPVEGDAVRTTVFTVNVHKSPADIYMEPIAGEEHASFISPANPINSVEWDESLGAFHLINLNNAEDDGRVFTFSRDYIEKIIQYTGAKSIVFEVKRDGIPNDCPSPDQVIYQGFYPQWYNAEEYTLIQNTDEWTKIEIFFDKIPLDADGNRKSIMLLSSKEGMYVRNIRPMTEGLFLTMDLEMTTLGGNWYEDVEIGLYPHSYEGDINDYNNRVTIKAGVKTTVKVRLDDFLKGGKVPGFGLVVYGGPEWNTELADGTYDRHTLKISNLRVSGEQNYKLDMNGATWAVGSDGTGFTWANSAGVASVLDGEIVIRGGYRYDGHKFTLDTEDPKNRTYLTMDMLLTTLGGSTDPVNIRLFNYNYEGSVGDSYTDLVTVTAGTTTKIKVKVDDYLVDGELPGFGFAVFGGPEWNTQLPNGTYDRHSIVLSNVRLEGAQEQNYYLDNATVATGTNGTGFTWANSAGVASIVDGEIVITNGFCYDAHEITLTEAHEPPVEQDNTYLTMNMLLTTLGGSTDPVNIRLFNYNYEGSVADSYTDLISVTAGTSTKIKVKVDDYLVDGELPGFGFAVFGGPEWNTQLPDGTYDRHSIVLSNVRLEGAQEKIFDLNSATVATGTNGTGFTWANSAGVVSIVDGEIVITEGFCYDAHEITLKDAQEPPAEEEDTYLSIDMLLTTLGNSNSPVELRFYPYNFEGSVHNNFTDKITVTAGEETTIKLELEKYLVDGKLPGIGLAIFGGPAWDSKLPDGTTPDRHTVTISGVYLGDGQTTVYDLSKSQWASGNNGTGYTDANGSGVAEIGSSIVITNGFCYDGHKISLVEAQEPPAEEEDTYLSIDMLLTTLGNSNSPVELRFYPYNFEGSVHNNFTDKITVTAGEETTIKLELEKYLVDGKLPGIGLAIFGGPAWDSKLPDGTTPDRHTVTISGVYLGDGQTTVYDLSKSQWASGNNGTGYTDANGSGVAEIGSSIVITNGFCYDGHKISLVEAQEPPAEEEDTYLTMDMLLTTLSNSSASVNIRLFNYNYEGSVGDSYTDLVTVTAGTTTKIKVKVDNYLVDGKLPGFGFAVFGGPEWNTQLSAGTYDRHSIVLSNVRLEGAQEQSYDLNNATVATGTNGTGYSWANSGGIASITDGELVITGGFCYDAHEITLPVVTRQSPLTEELLQVAVTAITVI